MQHSTFSLRARSTGVVAVLALIAAVLSPLAAAGSAQAGAASYTGTTSGSGGAWPDKYLGIMTVGEVYSDYITAPFSNFGALEVGQGLLPDGISIELDADPTRVHFFGTPITGGPFSFSIDFGGTDGDMAHIAFSGDVEGGVPATTTVVSSALPVAPYTAVSLSATVTGASPTGTVTFSLDGTSVGTGTVSGGVATYTGAVASSFIGSSHELTADYSGDSGNAASSSDVESLYIYGSSTVSGTVSRNGSAEVAQVRLLDSSFNQVASTTSTGGAYSLSVTSPTTVLEAQATYYIQAVATGDSVYYSSAGGAGAANVTSGTAQLSGPTEWTAGRNLYFNDPPVWTDQVLAQPRLGSVYSDGVAASGTATIQYQVSAGTLPAGLNLNTSTGAITGTPTDRLSYTFTLRAYNTYGQVTKQFTLEPGAAGVAPVFTGTTLAPPQVGTPFTSTVVASGDPTIVYSSSALPAGLVLNPSTGAITGTPTTAGQFEATITATNAFGHDDYAWEAVVAAAPAIDLVLDFSAGTPITAASTEISAGGLKVGSTYTLDLHSDPIRLYTGVVNSTGGFTWQISLPANTPVGAHQLILTGVAPDGTVMTANAWFTLLPDGTIGAVSYSGPFAALAFTGTSTQASLWLAVALLAMGGLLVAGRRVARRSLA